MKNLNHGASRATSRGHSSGHRNTRDRERRALYKEGGRAEFIEIDRERESEGRRKRERKRRNKHSAGPEEGGDLNTRYEIEPMGRVRRMQISLITHTGYFAIIIAVHARGRVSYDGEFRGYPLPGKICPLFAPLPPRRASRLREVLSP